MSFLEEFARYVPRSPSEGIDWGGLDGLFGPAFFSAMKATGQDPEHHGEGDVYVHTQMVCRELAASGAFHELDADKKSALFLAALLHDAGKSGTTRLENGRLVSPRHSSAGAHMVREFLWRDCGLCGTPEAMAFRETVCAFVLRHTQPLHLTDLDDAARRAREIASDGELAAGFSWRLLCMLAQADVRGRIANDDGERLLQVELAAAAAEDALCADALFRFADAFTKRAYLSGRNVPPDVPLYDDTWGEVVLLSGLPGTGKDTWIGKHLPGVPQVSLDGIRTELRVRPEDDQGRVAVQAAERAREYLRRKQPFVWNATDLMKETRQRLVGLFERYGARVRIVYLETDRESRIARNSARKDAVPESAVDRMLARTVPPLPCEAQTVVWECV